MSKLQPLAEIEYPAWERQKNESSKAFRAFTAYRDLPINIRSLTRAAKALKTTKQCLNHWSQAYLWAGRCELWDDELDRQARQVVIEDYKESKERHIQLAKGLQAVGGMVIQELHDKLQKSKDRVKDLPPTEARRMIAEGVTLERLTMGQATDLTGEGKDPLDDVDVTKLSDEEINRLDAGEDPERVLKLRRVK